MAKSNDPDEGHWIISCPSCHFETIDHDNFGFYFCERRRYCVHPCSEAVLGGKMRCLTCGVIHES